MNYIFEGILISNQLSSYSSGFQSIFFTSSNLNLSKCFSKCPGYEIILPFSNQNSKIDFKFSNFHHLISLEEYCMHFDSISEILISFSNFIKIYSNESFFNIISPNNPIIELQNVVFIDNFIIFSSEISSFVNFYNCYFEIYLDTKQNFYDCQMGIVGPLNLLIQPFYNLTSLKCENLENFYEFKIEPKISSFCYLIHDSIFCSISSNTDGGSMFFSLSRLEIKLINCAFYNCSSYNSAKITSGGAIAILSNHGIFNFSKCCVNSCFSSKSNFISLYSDGYCELFFELITVIKCSPFKNSYSKENIFLNSYNSSLKNYNDSLSNSFSNSFGIINNISVMIFINIENSI